MRLLLTFAFTLLIQISSFAQVDTSRVSFVSYWSKGDIYEFKVTKINQQWKEGALSKNDSSQYVVQFEVIDSTQNSYKIKWRYKNNIASTYNIPEPLKDKFSKYDMTEVVYKTTHLGEFVEIENWQEVGKMMKNLFSDLVEYTGNTSTVNKEQMKKSLEPLVSVYNSKEGVEQIVFKELQYFHFPFGVDFSTQEPLEYQEEMPNLFGDKPIKANARLHFESVDSKESRCVLVQQLKLDPEATRQTVSLLFKKMGLKDKEMKGAMEAAKFEITDNNRYEFYYNPGVPIRIETKRETFLNIQKEEGRRIDRTVIELL